MVLLVSCLIVAVVVAGELECEGPYKDRRPTAEELATVLRNHQAWLAEVDEMKGQKYIQELGLDNRRKLGLESDRKLNDTRRANLCRAHLADAVGGMDLQKAVLVRANLQSAHMPEANLHQADLAEADLQHAFLPLANLQEADLRWANFQDANLSIANLQDAWLTGANFQSAWLAGTNLQSTDLRGTNFQSARLVGANLQSADLAGANLQGADLRSAELTRVIYEPNLESLPQIFSLLNSRLEDMVFHASPAALLALREAFKKAGMRTQERQLTYAVKHTERLLAWDPSIKHNMASMGRVPDHGAGQG